MLRREDRLSPAIPRPFSLYDQAGDELVFLIKLLGRGTRALGDMQPGARLRLIGPLGNGWPTFTPAQPLVMLAGGIGSVPFLVGIADALREGVAAEDMTMIYGAATAAQLFEFERFAALGVRVLAATDDGSRGFAGHALECLAVEQEEGRIPPMRGFTPAALAPCWLRSSACHGTRVSPPGSAWKSSWGVAWASATAAPCPPGPRVPWVPGTTPSAASRAPFFLPMQFRSLRTEARSIDRSEAAAGRLP